METTKKTSTTKAALLVLAALSMLLSGLFIATASSSDAQAASCPAGFTLSADGANCSQPAADTTLDLGNTCATGFLSPSGTNCWIAATSMDQGGSTACPAGFSADALGACVASASATATVSDPACEAGASGTPATGCYTTAAQGVTAGAAENCTGVDGGLAFGDGTLTALGCEIDRGNALPTQTCSIIATGYTTGDPCTGTYPINGDNSCDEGAPNAALTACDTVGVIADASPEVLTCTVTGSALGGGAVTNGECLVWFTSVPAGAAGLAGCPAGTTELPDTTCYSAAGLATPTTTYTCATGSLNVTDDTPVVATCDSSSGFDATLGGVLYMCDAGTPAVVGTAVLCDLGAATSGVVTGPACLNGGVLSADEASCVVPATVTVAAPVPAFTG